MPFFQNVFSSDFEGNWVLGDRQHSPKYVCKRNAGRGDEIVTAWKQGTYNLNINDASGNSRNNLTIWYALRDFKNWASMTVNVATGAAVATAVTPDEIIGNLNSSTLFAERFLASNNYFEQSLSPLGTTTPQKRIVITQKKPITEMRFYIQNGTAEEAIGFNGRAGVAELPSYFARHTIANRFNYPDSQNALIQLVPATAVDAAVINNAVDAHGSSLNYSSGTVQADWQLLGGKSGIFNFQKMTVDGSNRITQIIEYPAGAKAGDLGRKTTYQYSGANTNPNQIAEVPYVLVIADLITP